jgi:hypothetical protein
VIEPLPQTHLPQDIFGQAHCAFSGLTGDQGGHHCIFQGIELRKQVMELKDKSDLTISQTAKRRFTHISHISIRKEDSPFGRRLKASHDMQKRGFTHP